MNFASLFILAIPQRWVLPGIRRSSLYSAVAIHAAQNSVRRAKKEKAISPSTDPNAAPEGFHQRRQRPS